MLFFLKINGKTLRLTWSKKIVLLDQKPSISTSTKTGPNLTGRTAVRAWKAVLSPRVVWTLMIHAHIYTSRLLSFYTMWDYVPSHSFNVHIGHWIAQFYSHIPQLFIKPWAYKYLIQQILDLSKNMYIRYQTKKKNCIGWTFYSDWAHPERPPRQKSP